MNALTFGATLERVLDVLGVERAEPPAAPIPADPPPLKQHGDPSIDPSGFVIPVDADCPNCGWPERTYDTRTRRFGCIRCTYESDERNA